MKNFKDFLVQKLGAIPSVRNAYGSEEEMLEHFNSGEVTVPFKDVVKYWDEFMEQNEIKATFKRGDKVLFGIQQNKENWICPMTAKVLAVHFYSDKEKYDLEIPIDGEVPTRVYNIDACFVQEYSEEAHRCYSIKDYHEKKDAKTDK